MLLYRLELFVYARVSMPVFLCLCLWSGPPWWVAAGWQVGYRKLQAAILEVEDLILAAFVSVNHLKVQVQVF